MEPLPHRRAPRPLALWARQSEPGPDASVNGAVDEFRKLVSQFSIPYPVAAVGYPRGARIGRVDVAASPEAEAEAADARTPVVILSRSALKMLRRKGSAQPSAWR